MEFPTTTTTTTTSWPDKAIYNALNKCQLTGILIRIIDFCAVKIKLNTFHWILFFPIRVMYHRMTVDVLILFSPMTWCEFAYVNLNRVKPKEKNIRKMSAFILQPNNFRRKPKMTLTTVHSPYSECQKTYTELQITLQKSFHMPKKTSYICPLWINYQTFWFVKVFFSFFLRRQISYVFFSVLWNHFWWPYNLNTMVTNVR